ncbi:class F sortase [Tenggerimyces flavus]|nr:class F sortase [Tenggerimyces flavus]MBM7790262.1 sortase (surface protein transpeptidase) [Tenggerimyces flavus]
MTSEQLPRSRRARILALVGATLALLGVAAVVFALVGQQPDPPAVNETQTLPTPPKQSAAPSPSASSAPPQASRSPSPAARPTPELELARSEPRRVRIPRLDVSSTLEHLELDNDGVMETPKDPAKAGWFTPSPTPGVVGSAILAGHITWDRRPAVFFQLSTLHKGDRIEVDRADRTTAVFKVERVATFPKNDFPSKDVYAGAGHAGLRLITCGGDYDSARRSYKDNTIVWARLVSSTPTQT